MKVRAPYSALHVRHWDFTRYKVKIQRKVLVRSADNEILCVATDERDKTF
jgi:hypothetical protein